MDQDRIGNGKIGVTTFITCPVPHNKCGSDGLPVTPNSIKVLGRAQRLKQCRHKNLCKYLDFKRGKHDRIFCLSEFHGSNLVTMISKQRSSILSEWYNIATKVIYEIIQGVAFLDKHWIVHHNLNPSNILLDSEGGVKLYAYGLYYMTNCGKDVSFPVGSLNYLSPEECMFQHLQQDHAPSSKVDVWSIGVIFLELCIGHQIFSEYECDKISNMLLGFVGGSKNIVLEMIKISGAENAEEIYRKLPDGIKTFLNLCLSADPTKRANTSDLLSSDLFSSFPSEDLSEPVHNTALFCSNPTHNFELPCYTPSKVTNPLFDLGYNEILHLWKLAGGDVLAEVKRSHAVHSMPLILDLPLSMSYYGQMISLNSTTSHLYDPDTIVLSLDNLTHRLKDVKPESYYPLVECLKAEKETEENGNQIKLQSDTSSLPLVIKENDIEYQLHRIILFKRLLLGYPHLRNKIWKEAKIDIPPFHRGAVWAALLDVQGDVKNRYLHIDKDTPLSSDRQIDVDIPRCHQYDQLLSSPTAHVKFKRVLKAWLKTNPHLSYWQGLDSLCAAFLHLNFNTEHLAWASMNNFIDKYLHDFFLKDNSKIIQEYLTVFRHLIAFHEPDLFNHLDSIGFVPELYSIPWFLTMFTHVFPLHKISHLWDTLLLGNSSFPLCVGVAILKQLKSHLMDSDFNECILMFSDLPEIDIDVVVQISIQLFCSTPKSATYRRHAKKKLENQNSAAQSEDVLRGNLSQKDVDLADLKSETCPRISASDLLQLCELQAASEPLMSARKSKPRICIIDVRSPDEFQRAAIPGSHNIPFSPTSAKSPQLASLLQYKQRVIIVVGNKLSREDIKFSSNLVEQGYRGVVVLHHGIDVLRPTEILTIQ